MGSQSKGGARPIPFTLRSRLASPQQTYRGLNGPCTETPLDGKKCHPESACGGRRVWGGVSASYEETPRPRFFTPFRMTFCARLVWVSFNSRGEHYPDPLSWRRMGRKLHDTRVVSPKFTANVIVPIYRERRRAVVPIYRDGVRPTSRLFRCPDLSGLGSNDNS